MSLSLEIVDGRTAFGPGEEIEVRVEWDLPTAPESIEVRMVWHTSGRGDRDMKIAKTVEISAPAAIGSQRLSVVLPRGPYSFSGKLISIEWGLELVVFPGNQSTRVGFVLAPGGREVLLSQEPQETDA